MEFPCSATGLFEGNGIPCVGKLFSNLDGFSTYMLFLVYLIFSIDSTK